MAMVKARLWFRLPIVEVNTVLAVTSYWTLFRIQSGVVERCLFLLGEIYVTLETQNYNIEALKAA